MRPPTPAMLVLELKQDILTSIKLSGEGSTETSLKQPELGSMEEVSGAWMC